MRELKDVHHWHTSLSRSILLEQYEIDVYTVSAIYSLCGWEGRVSLSDPRGHLCASWSKSKMERPSHGTT